MSDGSVRPSIVHRVEALRQRVAELVAAERADDPDPDDAFRGLYVADHHVDRVLANEPAPKSPVGATGADWGMDELSRLAERAELTMLDADLLVAALAPDLDPGFEKLYAYLNDDITRRRVSAGLALRLAGTLPFEPAARARLMPGEPLVDHQLVVVEDPDRPFLSRSLRVPDRVVQHLLGEDQLVPEVAALSGCMDAAATPSLGWPDQGEVERLARVLAGGEGFLHIQDPAHVGGVDLACAVLVHLDAATVVVDIERAPPEGVNPALVTRETLLHSPAGAVGLVVVNAERAQTDLLRQLTEQTPLAITVSREGWDTTASARRPVVVHLTPPPADARRRVWQAALTQPGQAGSNGTNPDAPMRADSIDLAALDTLRLSPSAIRRSVADARQLAHLDDCPPGLTHLRDAARLQASSRLERLARRVRPGVTWNDLIVGPTTRADLELLVARLCHHEQVLDTWGLRRRSGHAEGISALFTGDSGTGKTLAAEVLAGELGLDLYVIDLSTVVDKYIGETEKNLERIFSEAEGVNGVLFFDEADALFGKRSEVSDARDRYANTEIAYLLQRIETFDGFAVLATNLRANVDEAFLRRLSAVVEFPDPDEGQRRELWQLHMRKVPDDGRVDLDFLAKAFALRGGNIRNVALTTAYIAAAEKRPATMGDAVRAVALEYRKLGRLLDVAEFGPWMDELRSGPVTRGSEPPEGLEEIT